MWGQVFRLSVPYSSFLNRIWFFLGSNLNTGFTEYLHRDNIFIEFEGKIVKVAVKLVLEKIHYFIFPGYSYGHSENPCSIIGVGKNYKPNL